MEISLLKHISFLLLLSVLRIYLSVLMAISSIFVSYLNNVLLLLHYFACRELFISAPPNKTFATGNTSLHRGFHFTLQWDLWCPKFRIGGIIPLDDLRMTRCGELFIFCIIFVTMSQLVLTMCPQECVCISEEQKVTYCYSAALSDIPALLDPRITSLSMVNCTLKRLDPDVLELYPGIFLVDHF